MLAFALLALAAAPSGMNPNAVDLFERDAELKAWAITRFDLNGDGWLTSFEAQPALEFFKNVADSDGDGRVTVREYRAAKTLIAAKTREFQTAVSTPTGSAGAPATAIAR